MESKIIHSLNRARDVEEGILKAATAHGFSEKNTFAIRLALREAFENAFKHGIRNRHDLSVNIQYDITGERTTIVITDPGRGFDPGKLPDPTLDENLERRSGRGILLIRSFMDEVAFSDKGNEIRMVKFNSLPDSTSS